MPTKIGVKMKLESSALLNSKVVNVNVRLIEEPASTNDETHRNQNDAKTPLLGNSPSCLWERKANERLILNVEINIIINSKAITSIYLWLLTPGYGASD